MLSIRMARQGCDAGAPDVRTVAPAVCLSVCMYVRVAQLKHRYRELYQRRHST